MAAQSASSNTIQSSLRKTYESNLFVKNIPSDIKEEEIIALFEELGPVISIKLRQGKYFNPNAAYRQYFVLYKEIDSAKRAIQRFDQATPFGARPLSVQFWMPTQELHQEREQRSYHEVLQYFQRGFGGQMQGAPGMVDNRGGYANNNAGPRGNNQYHGGQRRDNRQGRGQYQNRDRQYNNNQRHGGPGGKPQSRDNNPAVQGQPGGAPKGMPVPMTPEQMQMYQAQAAQAQAAQAQMMGAAAADQKMNAGEVAGQQPGIGGIDLNALKQMDAQSRTQSIGNAIYAMIQPMYGDHTGKIVGMLLDNDRIVDPFMLVSNLQYLQQKAHEAYTLLSSQVDPSMGAPQTPAQTQ